MLAQQLSSLQHQNARPDADFRALSISHTAVSRVAGRLRYEALSATNPDIETHLVVPDRWFENGRWLDVDQPTERGLKVHVSQIRLPRAGPAQWYMHYYPHLRKLVKSIKPDVIHLWEEPWSLVALHAVCLRRSNPATAIVLEVDQNILKKLPPPFEQLRAHVLRQADFILGRSQDAINVVQAHGYAGPAALIGYAVDQTIFHPLDRAQCRREFGMNGFTIGCVGRVIVEKGIDDVVDALARCKMPVCLAVLGEGPHKAELVKRVSRLSLGHRVRFFPWAAPEKVACFMNALDVAVLVTRTTGNVREQFGRVIVEAHSCGVPVIGSSCGAIPDVIGEGGWIVAERDVAALSELLDKLASNPSRVAQAGFAGQRQASSRFSFAKVAESLAGAWRTAYAIRRAKTGATTAVKAARI